MGSDPDRSVVNSDHRAWEVPNLFIADGSLMPTQQRLALKRGWRSSGSTHNQRCRRAQGQRRRRQP